MNMEDKGVRMVKDKVFGEAMRYDISREETLEIYNNIVNGKMNPRDLREFIHYREEQARLRVLKEVMYLAEKRCND